MKKLVTTVLAGVMATSLVACSTPSNSGSASQEEDSTSSSDMKVAMITDYGDITDQSFNQTTYETCTKWAKENNVDFTYYKPADNSTADREASIDQAIEEGYNVIVTPGFAFAEALVHSAPNYEDVKFVALDVSQDDLNTAAGKKPEDKNFKDWSSENVFCAIYQEELAGYMAGVAAVKLGYKKLGFLGGMAIPAVQRYGLGFVQGVEAAATELGLTDVEINYAYGNQFNGDADITGRMDTWYSAGTEVVFSCGGSIYTSAAEAAAKVNAKIIGVDVDQAPIVDKDYAEGMTVTSAMKGLAPTVVTLLDAIRDGKWDEYKGKVMNLGLVSGDDLSKNYVQLSDSTQWADGFTEDDYKKLVADMYDGTVKVNPDTTVDLSKYEGNVKVNFEGNIK